MKQFLLIAPVLCAFVLLANGISMPAQHLHSKSKGYVLLSDEGEKLEDPAGGIIKVSPQVGSQHISMVVQPLKMNSKIGVTYMKKMKKFSLCIKVKAQ